MELNSQRACICPPVLYLASWAVASLGYDVYRFFFIIISKAFSSLTGLYRAFWCTGHTYFTAYGGGVGREGVRTPRAPTGGLAALLHHSHFQHHGYIKKPEMAVDLACAGLLKLVD